jgi:hypothetical protein
MIGVRDLAGLEKVLLKGNHSFVRERTFPANCRDVQLKMQRLMVGD